MGWGTSNASMDRSHGRVFPSEYGPWVPYPHPHQHWHLLVATKDTYGWQTGGTYPIEMLSCRKFFHTRCKRQFCRRWHWTHITSDWTSENRNFEILWVFRVFTCLGQKKGDTDKSSLRQVRFNPREVRFSSHLSDSWLLDISVPCHPPLGKSTDICMHYTIVGVIKSSIGTNNQLIGINRNIMISWSIFIARLSDYRIPTMHMAFPWLPCATVVVER